MSGSSGGGTTVQKNEPSDFSKPYITPGFDEALSLFKEGPSQYYPGNTVANPSQTTQAVWDATSKMGLTAPGQRAAALQGSTDALNRFAGGGLGDWDTVAGLRNLGNGDLYGSNPVSDNMSLFATAGPGTADRLLGRTGDIITTGGNNLAQFRADTGDIINGTAQAANPGYSSLGLTAGGAYLNSNPYVDATYGKAADAVTRNFKTAVSPGVDGRFAMSAGAGESGAATNARDLAEKNLGDSLGKLATDIYGGNYATERGLQENASNNLASLYQSGLGLRASTAGTSAGQGTADTQARLAAANAVQGAESSDASQKLAANNLINTAYSTAQDQKLAATKAASDAYLANRAQQLQGLGLQTQNMQAQQDMDYKDLDAARASGAGQDAYSQNLLNADITRFDTAQNAPWTNLQRYLAAIGGGSMGSNTSVTTPGGSPMASLLSGAGGIGQLALAMKGLGLF